MYKHHISNEEIKIRIRQAIGLYEDLLIKVKRRKWKWYGHTTRSSGLAETVLQGTVPGERKRQKKRWEDSITEWTGLKMTTALRKTKDRRERREPVTGILSGAPTVIKTTG